jgi:hypothetical protein
MVFYVQKMKLHATVIIGKSLSRNRMEQFNTGLITEFVRKVLRLGLRSVRTFRIESTNE